MYNVRSFSYANAEEVSFSFSFKETCTLFKVATNVAAWLESEDILYSPFSTALNKIKFKCVKKDKTVIWYVRDDGLTLEEQRGKITFIRSYKTSESPKLKDIFNGKNRTIEFSYPKMF